MLDIRFIRDNKDLIVEASRKKRLSFNVEELIALDDRRRDLLARVEKKRSEQNTASASLSGPMETPERETLLAAMKVLKEELHTEEEELAEVQKGWQKLMLEVPNVPDISVPEGADDSENQEVKVWGEKPTFSFAPKSHTDLMQALDMVDFERGTKVAGFRGYFLKGAGAELAFALWQYGLEHFKSRGFNPMLVPSLVKREALLGTGYLPQGEDDLYKTQDGEYLAGTGEVGTMAYFMDEVLEEADLPMKILAFSPCFRREAGSHGKDTKGLMRVHEFFKLEQVVLSKASHESSVEYHELINRNTEELMESLGIPYHTVANCGGDLGLGQVKKYDIELWIPSEGTYREISSASYFHDFQTRRINLKYRDAEGKLRYVHSLNCTALPTPRILIALVENNQNEDGSIRVPLPLQKYLGRDTIRS